MTKKGKRTALLQRAGEIKDLQAENERLRARLAGYEKGPGPSRLYGLLADNASDVVWLADMDLNLTYVSPSAARMLGCGPEEMMTPAVKDMLLPEPVCRQIADFRERMAPDGGAGFHGQRGLTLETSLHLGDGSDIWVEESIDLVRGEAGRPAGVMGIARDVTGRKQAEEELRLSGERSRLLLDNASEGIAVVQDGVLRLVNPRLAQMSGYTMEELISRPFAEVVHPDDRERVAGHYARRIEGEESSEIYQCRFVDKAGRTRWGETNVARIEWEGKPAILAVVGDISERVAARQALEESERLYRLLADNSSDVIWTSDPDMRITYVSPSVARVLGYSPDEIKAMPFERWFPPSSLDLVARIHTEDLSAESRQPGSVAERVVDVEMVARDGSLVWVEAAVKGIRDAEGRLVGFQGACREITQRKKAQEAMAASEERFRTIFQRAPIGAVVYDSNGAPVQANEASVGIFGVSSDGAVRGPSLFDYHGLTDEEKRRVRAGETVSGEAQVDLDADRALGLYSTARSGKVYVRLTAAPLGLEEDGSARGYLAMLEDITKRRQAEEALRESEERYRMLADNASDVIWTMDLNMTYTYNSPSKLRQSGYTPEEFQGLSAAQVLTPESLERAVRAFQEELALEQVPDKDVHRTRVLEMAEHRKDGSLLWTEATASFLRDKNGQAIGIIGISRDITERKKGEEALREAKEYAENLIRTANVLVLQLDTEGRATLLNEAGEKITGYGQADVVGRNWLDLVAPKERYPHVWEAFRRYRAGRAVEEAFEAPLITRSGDERIISLKNNLLVHDGEVVGTLSFGMDVTEHRRAEAALREAHAELEARVEQRTAELKEANEQLVEEAGQRQEAQARLQESEARYRGLVESANSIIMELDTRGKITFFNRFAREFYGFGEAEIIGRQVVGTIAPPVDSTGNDLKAWLRDLVKHPEEHLATEGEGMLRNGDRVWISWTNKGLYDSRGRLRNLLCIGMDRTEQRRTAEMLAEQAKEKAAAEERQRLARELHDAVTQMLFSASIIAAVLPRLWAKDQAEGLRRLDELRQLTRGALAEMRLLLLELRPTALAEVGLGDLLRHLAEATSGRAGFPVSFTFEGQCTAPADVQMALYRVSQEALANAVKHSRASEAKVHLFCERQSATVTVADNGCGFDVKGVSPEHLGLRIMQERAEAVGAAVTVVSSKRRGTEVRAVWSKAGRKERP